MKLLHKIKHFLLDPTGKRNKLLLNSEVFCMAPWVQLHAQTNGKVAPCCMSAMDGTNEIGDLNQDPNLFHAWNSEKMRNLRLDMLSGKKNSLCNNCYKYQDIGRNSERLHYNRDFQNYFERVNQTKKDGTINEKSIPILDIRFSNKCNYKCRICNSDYSTLWYDEEIKLGKKVNPANKEIKVAADEIKFWEAFKTLLPTVKRIHFAGGEPLFMDEHYATLEYLIEIGNTDVNLTYNTNFSTLRYKRYNVIELWKKFRQVDIWASLDGMDQRGDYQRKGQKWNEIEENIRTIQNECTNIYFGVNATVSIFNVLHMPDFFKHLIENKLVTSERVNLYPLMYPEQFCVDNLTLEIKDKVRILYKELDETYLKNLPQSDNIRNHFRAIVTLMNEKERDLKKDFRESVISVDAIRNENFGAVFPELLDLIEEK